MASGPRGEKRPADVIGCAVAVARLSVGEGTETTKTPSGKVRSGCAGGAARANLLTSEQRQKIAKKAALARWG